MKTSWGVGVIVAILVSASVGLFGILNLSRTLSLMLLLIGLWTLVSAFALVEEKDRSYYSAWGVVVAFLSLFAYVPFDYSLGLIFLAVVALIFVNLYWGRASKKMNPTQGQAPQAGNAPAASPTRRL